MIEMKMSQYLDKHVAILFGDDPFKNWQVSKYLEDDLDEPRIYYVFMNKCLELFCGLNESVRVIFLQTEEIKGFKLSEIPFDSTRRQVLEHFGAPLKSGDKIVDPILGEFGAWDLFSCLGYATHVEYRIDSDAVKKITLMCIEAIP